MRSLRLNHEQDASCGASGHTPQVSREPQAPGAEERQQLHWGGFWVFFQLLYPKVIPQLTYKQQKVTLEQLEARSSG